MAESISVDLNARDNASSAFRSSGRSAADAAVKYDLAAASLKVYNDVSAKSAKADATSVAALRSHTKATALLADAERVLGGEATKTTRLMADSGRAVDDAGKKAAGAAGFFSNLAGGGAGAGATGMGALIGAGVALSPVIATVGVGLAGLGAAAYGIAKPIENAAQKAGGLAKNMQLLNPEQQAVARGILSLGKDFAVFQQQLQPAVLGDFSGGLRLAATLMHDVEPVAVATGKAIGGLLGQIDAEFKSQTWQNFFGFMASNAGPDVKLLGGLFVNLTNALPPLLTALQPLATELLKDASGAAALIGDIGTLTVKLEDLGKGTYAAGQSAEHTGGVLGFLANATKDAFGRLEPGIPLLGNLQQKLQQYADQSQRAALASGKQAAAMTALDNRVTHTRAATAGLIHPVGAVAAGFTTASAAFYDAQHNAKLAEITVRGLADAVQHLNTQLANAINPNQTFNQDLINTVTAAAAAEKALDGTKDKIGLNTAAQRTAFGAQLAYIGNLVTLAKDAGTSRDKQQEATAAIQNALPQLKNVSGGTKQYWQEVRTLIGYLDHLRQEKAIAELIHISAAGTWSIAPSKKLGLPGGTACGNGPPAAGGLIPGAGNADNYPALLTPGEVVVPKPMVSAGAVDHLRGRLPGFAAGGLVPSYTGPVAGLPPWTNRDLNATQSALTAEIGGMMAAAFKAANAAREAAALRVAGGSGGPASGTVRQEQAYAASLFRFYGWGPSQLPPLIALWNGESSWNRLARNPTSGAFGIPQALPPGKMGALAASGNAAAQIRWGEGYIHSVYGTPANAYGTWLSRSPHWYGDGLANGVFTKPTLIGVGERGPEMVSVTPAGHAQRVVLEIAPGGEGALTDALLQVLRKQVRIKGGGNVQLALGRP